MFKNIYNINHALCRDYCRSKFESFSITIMKKIRYIQPFLQYKRKNVIMYSFQNFY